MDLKEWFRLEGIKQRFIARKIGITDGDMSKIVSRKKRVLKEVADKIVWITNGVVTYDDLDLATYKGEAMSKGKKKARVERAKKNES